MDLDRISTKGYLHTMFWAIGLSALIVTVIAGLARATLNLNAALVDKPDIAIYMLLPEEGISTVELLRETVAPSGELQRDYLTETEDGPLLVILRRGVKEWYVLEKERLRE